MKSYRDIVGDGGSNVLAQVGEQKRAVADALSQVRRIVAVGSGKGGVGKSTLTFLLGLAATRSGARVAILDADLNGPSQARMAGVAGAPWIPSPGGLEPPRRGDGLAVVSVGSILPESRHLDLPARAVGDEHVWRSTREFSTLGQILSGIAWGALDLLLVDLPPGSERTRHHAGFLPRGTSFLLVTVPSAVARGVVERSLSALAAEGSDVLGYVENMSGYVCRDCGQVRELFPPPATELPLERLASIPFDPVIAAACDRGWPDDTRFHGPAAEAIERLAAGLLDPQETRP